MAEATVPGANVSAVARSHGLSPQQVFTWRRQAVRRARRETVATGACFAVVEVDGMANSGATAGSTGDVVELLIGEVTLRVGPAVPASRVRELLRAVRSA